MKSKIVTFLGIIFLTDCKKQTTKHIIFNTS